MSINPTYVSAAIEPSSVVQGHVHFNIHKSMSDDQLNSLYLKIPKLGFFKTFKNPYICFGF
jgi:hypothetical protein